MSRRTFLEVTAGGLAGLALGCNQAPSARPSPTPQELSITERALLPQKVIEQIEEARNTPTPPPLDTPTPLRTPVSIPELTPKPTSRPTSEPARTPTPEPTRTPVPERPPTVLWSTNVTASPLKNRLVDSQPPAYAGEGNQFFMTTSNKEVIALQTDGPQSRQVWKWTNRGNILGYDSGTVFLMHADTSRIYAIDATTKEEIWKHNISGSLFFRLGSGYPSAIRWPIFTSKDFIGVQTDIGSFVCGKRNDYFFEVGYLILGMKDNLMVLGEPPRGYVPSKYYVTYDLLTKKPVWETSAEFAEFDEDGLFTSQPTGTRDGSRDSLLTQYDLGTGRPRWTIELPSNSQFPLYFTKNFVVIGKRVSSTAVTYFLTRKNEGGIAAKLTSPTEGIPYVFSGSGDWLFASHRTAGTTAFFKEKKVWENDEVLEANEFVGEFDNIIVLARNGKSNPLFPQALTTGIVWGLTRDGKKFAWPPLQFAEMTATRHVVNSKLIVADRGRNNETRIHSIDIKSGKKLSTNPGFDIASYLSPTSLEGILVGQGGISTNKFFALRV